jgi:2-polyprenyl-3-methyl-5-hydroxy-6-metoxy-1,4-benzoquinol methylase
MISEPSSFNLRLLKLLGCPWDHSPLEYRQGSLICAQNHEFQVEQEVAILTKNPRREPIPQNMEPCSSQSPNDPIDPFVNDWIINTNGNLYRSSRGKLPRYPIPQWPLPAGEGKSIVDLGCSWGRWSIAAARAGYRPIGVDVHLDALWAAYRVSRQLGLSADFVCAEADQLPFLSQSVDLVFSYSVLQHLDKSIVTRFFAEVCRILKPAGVCFVQLPNRFGVLSMLRQLKRGFRDAAVGTFEMRYWTISEIERTVTTAGLSMPQVRTDGFFSQNPQVSDLDLLSPGGKLIVSISEAGRRASEVVPVLTDLADSLWIETRSSR